MLDRAAELGNHALARLQELMKRAAHVGDVLGRGLLLGVEIVEDRDSMAADNARAERIYYRCLEAGLSFKISQGNVLTLSPPLVIARADLDRALDIVTEAVLGEDT